VRSIAYQYTDVGSIPIARSIKPVDAVGLTDFPTQNRPLDLATHLVAPIEALAQGWLEAVTCVPALRRVPACAVARFNSFSFARFR
jgi:hypothetical protein